MSNEQQISSSHSIKLEGCGKSRFQLHLRAPLRPTRNHQLDEADLTTFCEFLPTTRPNEICIISNRDEWHELNDEIWNESCHAIGACSETLLSFEFSTMFCRSGYNETKIHALVPHIRQLNELIIKDGLYTYTETFLAMSSHLHHLKSLTLKNSAPGSATMEPECCAALAQLIRSLPRLRKFELSNVRFASKQCWNLVYEALLTCDELHDVSFYKLTAVDDASDFAMEILRHTHFDEQHAIMNYLKRHCVDPSGDIGYSLTQRLSAVLHVRTNGIMTLDKARTDTSSPKVCHIFSILSDRLDLCYHFLRNEIDPSSVNHFESPIVMAA